LCFGTSTGEFPKYEREYERNRASLMNQLLSDWQFKCQAVIDGEVGYLAMDGEGSNLRLVSCKKEETRLTVVADETIPLRSVTSIAIDQPNKTKTITHTETTPVAVGSGRSPVGRAVVGGLVAGPVGAVVGGLSGVGGKSKIEHVTTKRHETVYVKEHPKLIVRVDDLIRPRRIFVFETVRETNDWSARIFAAMNRARR